MKPIVHLLLCHSPDSPGYTTANGWSERTFARDVNSFIFNKLNRHKVNVWLHEQDTLERRIKYLKRCAAQGPQQCAIEVHFNAFPSILIGGYMTLHHAKSIHGLRLARHIHAEVGKIRPDAEDLGLCPCEDDLRFVGTNRQFPAKRLALLEDVKQWSVIPEPVTLSNENDLKWITKFDSRKTLGYAIAQGITDFLETLTQEDCHGQGPASR